MNKTQFNINDYTPKRFGLNYNPPQIIIEYLVPSSGKLYHHKMRLHKFSKEKNTADAMRELYERHPLYLDKKKVNSSQIMKLIDKLKANFKPKKNTNSTTANTQTETKKIVEEKKEEPKIKELKREEDEDEYGGFDELEDENLNDLDDEEVKEKKAIMDIGFEKNRIKKEDKNFEYEVRQDFDNDQYEAEWDDDSY